MKRKRLKNIILILWVTLSFIVLLVFPIARKGLLGLGSPAMMTTFEAKDGSYSISYPANWVAGELPQGNHGDDEVIAIITVSGRSLANIIIARKSFSSGTADDVLAWGKSRASQRDDYLAISFLPFSNGNMDGFAHTYQWSSPTIVNRILRRCQDVYLLAGEYGYALTFCSQEKDWHSLDDIYVEMMQSFLATGGAK